MNATEQQQSVWTTAFSEGVRDDQLQVDSEAWRAVTGILLTIVSIGAGLAIFTVWICS